MSSNQIIPKGLSDTQVVQSREEYGNNNIEKQSHRLIPDVLKDIFLEPMFLLLLAACVIYFLAGQNADGIIMLISILYYCIWLLLKKEVKRIIGKINQNAYSSTT